MVQENISFIRSMIKNDQPAYNILSFISDTVDTMRTELSGQEMDGAKKAHFLAAVGRLADALEDLDKTMGAD